MSHVCLFFLLQVGGELSPLLDKNLNILRKLAKIIALLLEPLSGPVHLQQGSQCDKLLSTTLWDYIYPFASLILPLTHPSNTGKWTQPLSHFVSAFVQAYTRRVARERMSDTVVTDSAGRLCGTSQEGTGTTPTMILSYRLGRPEDEKIVELFLPVLLQGIYSKNHTAGTSYEAAIKRLCYLSPSLALERVLEQLTVSLEAVTESHQLQASLRLLTQLIPLTIQHLPGVIPQLLRLILPAIDGAEPFKTVQALTFYSVLFSHIGCQDLASSMEIDDFPIEQASEVRGLWDIFGT